MLSRVKNNNLALPRHFRFSAGIGLSMIALAIAACIPQSGTLPVSSPSPITSSSPVSPTLEPSPQPTISPYRSDFPDPTGYDWSTVISGMELPVDIQNAGDGSERLFFVEKRGQILVFQNEQLMPHPFLDIRSEVGSRGNEQGLLGLTFHPLYAQNGTFFVNYTDINGNTVVARFHVSADDSNRADPSSETVLLHVNQPYANHNGGGLAFGPDGFLYIGLGDGGSGGDPQRNGQNLQTMLGKLLRVNVDAGDLYAPPANNPFSKEDGLPEIWAYGLRNPWRFSFDRLTGDLYISDVGQDAWEEVDFVPKGALGGMDFGWSYYEGTHPYQDQPPTGADLIGPVTEYPHSEGCSVTGGYVYRGSDLPEWQGVYLFGDYCSGTIWGLIQTDENIWQSKVMFSTGAQITTFGVDEAGEIYLVDYQSGSILRLTRR